MDTAKPERRPEGVVLAARLFAVVVVALVATYDGATGVYMLTSKTPFLAHGDDTVWTRGAAELSGSALSQAARASWARLGAFQLFAGISTWVWLLRGWKEPRVLTTLLVVYVVAGLGFGLTDGAWFDGTPYLVVKRVVGVLWVLALAAQLWSRRRERAVDPRAA